MMRSIPLTEGQIGTPAPKARRTVRILMLGGIALDGNLVLPQTRGIAELLNRPQAFIEFECSTGKKMHIAKSAIQTIEVLDIPKTGTVSH